MYYMLLFSCPVLVRFSYACLDLSILYKQSLLKAASAANVDIDRMLETAAAAEEKASGLSKK